MKVYLALLIAFISVVTYSQEKGIVIHKKNSERIEEISEFKRIKVVTIDGNKYVGRFKIIDSASIQIEGNVIALNSIVKMKRKSLFGTIANPIFIATGAIVITACALIAPVDGLGLAVAVIYTPPGLVMVLVPAISNNHKSKYWEYSIKYTNKKYPNTSPPLLGASRT